jgi:alanine racemase
VILEGQTIPPDARSVLTIDLAALVANWRQIADRVHPAACAGVVKADGYGLGITDVATALARAGCSTFFVATLAEGRAVRAALPPAIVYVLDGLLPGAAAHYAAMDLRPCLSSLEEIREWAAWCAADSRPAPAAIHIDTGMQRLGLTAADVDTLAGPEREILSTFPISLVMSHLACADVAAHPLNETQRTAFLALAQRLPRAPLSLANSAGTFLDRAYHLDLVRPGIALYGGRASTDIPNPMRPVTRLSARILQVRTVAAGTPVGYGATFTAPDARRIATVASGYADGFLRALSGPIERPGPLVTLDGHRVPVVGRVSMDVIALDVTGIPEREACRGAWVELIGPTSGLDDLADHAGTIGYELLTRLGRRSHRVVLDGSL